MVYRQRLFVTVNGLSAMRVHEASVIEEHIDWLAQLENSCCRGAHAIETGHIHENHVRRQSTRCDNLICDLPPLFEVSAKKRQLRALRGQYKCTSPTNACGWPSNDNVLTFHNLTHCSL